MSRRTSGTKSKGPVKPGNLGYGYQIEKRPYDYYWDEEIEIHSEEELPPEERYSMDDIPEIKPIIPINIHSKKKNIDTKMYQNVLQDYWLNHLKLMNKEGKGWTLNIEQSFFRKIISSCLKELIQEKDEFERLHNLKIQDRYEIVNSHIAKSIKKTDKLVLYAILTQIMNYIQPQKIKNIFIIW